MGVALRAVADDRDGLAVEQREVCVVVVDHWRAGYPTAPASRARGQALAPARDERARRDPAARRPRRCSGARRARSDARISLDLRLGAATARRRGSCGERSSVISQNSSKLAWRRDELERLDLDIGEARLARAARARARRRRARTGPARCSARRRGREAALGAAPRAGSGAQGCARSRPTPPARARPPGRSTRRVSAQRSGRVGHQHVAPAAEHGVHARDRQVDPFRVQHLELDVLIPSSRRALARAGEHRLGLVGDEHLARRARRARPRAARSRPSPPASSSTRSPGCGASASTSQLRRRARRRSRISSCRRRPAAAAASSQSSRLALAVCVRRRSSSAAPCAGACPSACAAAASATSANRLGTLYGASAARAVRAQLLRASTARRILARRDDERASPPRPTARRARRARAASSTSGWLSSTASTSAGRHVLPAADDRLATCARAPTGARGRRARRGRPCAASRRARAPPARWSGRATRISPSAAIRTRVQNSGGPAASAVERQRGAAPRRGDRCA